ncbi:hypothetical protein QPK87_01270 [Kamptonema cortianum]|nr:hypothetical protein [Geitlerinema splendidum]MDK3155218.1 hypothetical protein [Kamptonema cortianum]
MLLLFAAASMATLATPQQRLTFNEIEQRKYEAFASHSGFKGKFVVITIPGEGAGTRQEVEVSITPIGKRIKVTVNGVAQMESGRTKDERWLAFHPGKVYQLKRDPGNIELNAPYKPLTVESGSLNFSVNEYGPRFATDPAPTITSQTDIEEEGRKVTRVDATATNTSTRGKVEISQVFDRGTWITRRFELVMTKDGKQLMRIVGFLQDDNQNANLAASFFTLPSEIQSNFKRRDG